MQDGFGRVRVDLPHQLLAPAVGADNARGMDQRVAAREQIPDGVRVADIALQHRHFAQCGQAADHLVFAATRRDQ